MQIAYKDTIFDVKNGTKVRELLKNEIEKSENQIVAWRFNNEIKGLNYKLKSSGTIELIDITEKDGMRVYQRGLIYIVAKAFHDIYPEALITINYQLYHSMFCEVDNLNLTEKMIEKVSKRVREIIECNLPIERKTMSKEEASMFYEREKTLKGRFQMDLVVKKVVTLYYC